MFSIRNDRPQKSVHMMMALAIGMNLFKDESGQIFALDSEENVPSNLKELTSEEIKEAQQEGEENTIHISTT